MATTTRTTPFRRPAKGGAQGPGAGLAAEIGKKKPFDLPEQEAYLNLVRTNALLSADFHRLFKERGLSESTFNLLRILRGTMLTEPGTPGRPCHELGERMIAQVPDVTRLVDRLEESGLARRHRCEKDRRVVYISITEEGLKALADLDKPVLELHKAQLGHLSESELKTLSRLLTKARRRDAGG